MELPRRTFLRASLAMGAAGLAGGCSSSAAPPGATRVRLWSWLTGMDRYVAAFNGAQRDVFVELRTIAAGLSGGYAQQTNAIRAHNAPDILHVEYQGLPQILLTGGLRDLTADLAGLGSGYSPAAWLGTQPDGRTWAVPMDLAPMVFYYRKDLYDKHGIPVPRTWDEFRAAADAVRKVDANARITTFPLNDGSFFAGMCWQAGDPWWRAEGDTWQVNIAGEGTLRTAAFWQSMVTGGLVAGVNHGTQDWIAAMHDGRLWGLLGASWSVGSLNRSIPKDTGRWAVTTMPTWNGLPANGIQGGTAFGVSAESDVPEAATTFLRWLSTDPAVPRIGAQISTPFPAYLASREVAKGAYKSGYFLGEPVYDVLEEAAKRVPEWTWGPNALRLFSTIVDNFGGVRTGGTTLPDAMRRVQAAAVADMRDRGLSVREGSRA
ncbi:multiple sugar transport system substrate-binding protein [Kibdelosporangium banguiense]|uniref:Multiple sugar transport system substrate-binding protein n=1 Tax=Kibdelosporangium banguiense TaxID=1365924 RepID=A0ABS4TU68_9PSEU|nr:extracellular solute-binding protein [Kibdelosporangium banguiense]MBP2327961.1 multiple sugar transport system substrate-binding protein [Kibdelosporangium banguiense]